MENQDPAQWMHQPSVVRDEMDIAAGVLCGTIGSLIGSIFNYWLALKLGRPFFQKFGKYMFVKIDSLDKAERFFDRHGMVKMRWTEF